MKQFTSPTVDRLNRRDFLKVAGNLGLSAIGMTLLDACGSKPATEADGLETTTIRIPGTAVASLCQAPQFVAEDFLKAEGFTDVQYPRSTSQSSLVVDMLASGEGDMVMQFSGPSLLYLDTGKPITVLAGVHVGCFELFGSEQINELTDLKGKTVALTSLGGPEHVFLSSMLAYVGLNPNQDLTWTVRPGPEAKKLFVDGNVDAFLAFPPNAQDLHAKKIGHVVVDSITDKPWSQYFCCMATFNRDFVQQKPVATKRALRALLKAADVCAREPERAAKLMVDKGFTENYDYALAAMHHIPYDLWRDYDPEDTLRFYALRLHEAGMLKSSPEEIIAQGTNWTFLNELKAELKADNPSLPEHERHSEHGLKFALGHKVE